METIKEDELVEKYKRYIYSIAQGFTYRADIDDLFQVGWIGLQRAFQNFDDSLGIPFLAFAKSHVFGQMYKYACDNNLIKVNKDLIILNRKVGEAREKMTQVMMRVPTTAEVAAFLEVAEDRILEAQAATDYVMSLDYELGDDEGKEVALYDRVSYIEPGYDDNIMGLRTAINELPEEERQLIVSRYYEDRSQSETGKVLQMSQVQVSRKETKVLAKLYDKIAS